MTGEEINEYVRKTIDDAIKAFKDHQLLRKHKSLKHVVPYYKNVKTGGAK